MEEGHLKVGSHHGLSHYSIQSQQPYQELCFTEVELDKDSGGGRGLNVGGGEWAGQGRLMGEKWGHLQLNNNENK